MKIPKKTYNPCDDCQYSYSKQNQESNTCRICEFKKILDAEEQSLLLRLPCELRDVIDVLFSHNEIVSLWIVVREKITYHQLIWRGEAWKIPEKLKSYNFVKIFGTIPEKITQADIINVEVALSEETGERVQKYE